MLYQIVVSFIVGLVLEKYFHLGWPVIILITLVSISAFLASRFAKIFLVVGLALSVGIFRMSLVTLQPPPNILNIVGERVSFEGVISDEPDVRDTSVRYKVQPNSLFDLTKQKDFYILVISDRFPKLNYGDRIKVSGKLDLPKNFKNENDIEFDYVSYLAKDHIYFLTYRPTIEKVGESQFYFLKNLYNFKNQLINNIARVVPEPNASFLAGVIFGAKQSIGQSLLDAFKKIGLIHIVVLSGYNITIIATLIFYLAKYFDRHKLGFIFSIIFISLFALMVGLSATVIRACIMAFIAILAKFLGRENDALRWLFIAAFFMLLWNPISLFADPSFQLSFMATLGLILFSPLIEKLLATSFLTKIITTKFEVREIISATLAVQIFILPLLIKMSGFISLISFFINPLALPLVPSTMLLGALTGVTGIVPFVGQFLSWPFGIVSYFLTNIIIWLTETSAQLPFATINLPIHSFWPVLIWYSFYAFLYLKYKKASKGDSSEYSKLDLSTLSPD